MSEPIDACLSALSSLVSSHDPIARFLPNLISTFLGALLGILTGFFVNTRVQNWKDKREVREIRAALDGELNRSISVLRDVERAQFMKVAEIDSSFLDIFLKNSKCSTHAPASALAASYRYKESVDSLAKLLAVHDAALETDDLTQLSANADVVLSNNARLSQLALRTAIELQREIVEWTT